VSGRGASRSLFLAFLAAVGASAACSAYHVVADAGDEDGVDAASNDAAQKVDVGAPPDSGRCSPNTTTSCYCSGTAVGTATCQSDGVFGACQCPHVDAGSGCPQALCNGACCAANQLCVRDSTSGQDLCADTCTTNSDCGSTGCCAALSFPDAGNAWNGQSACVGATANNGYCRCEKSAECPGGQCTPFRGFYTCQPNNGGDYGGCAGSVICGTGYDCVGDCNGNEYCAASSASNCTNGWCPVGSPPCHNAIESCSNDCMLCTCE
jgi:hypothetical protein